ncbi:hypothetical protein [Galactobacter sp.]|uniref:hypothetical protein n=1 Tax=Galactobacter sp. TaxID=2676125 RepID=UPI0025BE2433|nr:hypothetical protein [Galactobacter sp.]
MSDAGIEIPVRATIRAEVLGDDLVEPSRILRGELGDPHLVPLPGAVGLPGTIALPRTVVHLADLPVSLTAHGWRLTGSRAGYDAAARRTRSHQRTLLGIAADLAEGRPLGPTSMSVVGPATLVARLALPSGEPVLSDAGAVRDVAQAWIESMAALAGATEASLPGTQAVLDVVEPDLAAVTSGTVRSSSGYRQLPAWDKAHVGEAWTELARRARTILPVQAAGLTALRDLPALTTAVAGPDGEPERQAVPRVAVRIRRPDAPEGYVPVATWVESGHDVVVEIPTPDPAPGRVANLARSVAVPWRRLGLDAAALTHVVVATGADDPVTPLRLRGHAATARDCADALELVRHDDLEAIA